MVWEAWYGNLEDDLREGEESAGEGVYNCGPRSVEECKVGGVLRRAVFLSRSVD